MQALKKFLVENPSLNLNAIEPTLSKAPIHSLLLGNRPQRNRLLEVFLTYGNVDVNLQDLDGSRPLHLAIKVVPMKNIRRFVYMPLYYPEQ